MKKLFLTTAFSAVLLGATSMGAWADMTAQDFVTKASTANMFEIQSSQLALERAEDPRVKGFAQEMIEDHVKAGESMKTALSQSKEGAKPADQLDDAHMKSLEQLKAASGAEFDTLYIAAQSQAHQDAVALFSEYASNGADPALKSFAETTLPTLQGHADSVDKLENEKESPHN